MARTPKPNGRGAACRCRTSKEFVRRVEGGGGRIEKAEGGGSHFWGIAPNGDMKRAYDTNGGEYPKGTACDLGKWLKAVGLMLVFVGTAAALLFLATPG